jgi:hypothetical protein
MANYLPYDFPVGKNAVDPGFSVNMTAANITLEKTDNTTVTPPNLN